MDCTNKKIKVIFGDVTIGIKNEQFHCIFSYQTGGLESLVIDGKEWLYRTPKPTFWRATTDNDRGCGFPYSSGMWLGADMFLKCVDTQIKIDGNSIKKPVAPENNRYSDQEYAQNVEITFIYETNTAIKTQVEVSYTISAEGKMDVSVQYFGKKGLPGLPAFGMRFVIPTITPVFEYNGLSGETYPDRMAGGVEGTYKVYDLPVTKYIVPQECGMHMNTKWVTLYRNTVLDNTQKDLEQFKLTIQQKEKPFAFSCLPYTALELENATHHEELPIKRRTVLCIYGAVRGVGGIDSWGTDVEEQYRVSGEEDISFSFTINLT